MDFKSAVTTCLNKYVVFQGRASRSEYWYYALALALALIVAIVLDSAMGMGPYGLFYAVVVLGTFLPSLAAQVRRLHDTGRSGWWVLIGLVPLVGLILLIIWFCEKGGSEANAYGPAIVLNEPPAPASGAAGSSPHDLERLGQLHALHEKGALTAEEFAAAKAKILG